MVRKYEQRARAEKQEETRRRIVDAALELHGTLGPTGTSLSAVAERAGVQRNTLYRHFPDERTLLMACSGLHGEVHPIPDPAEWAHVTDPLERLRAGLRALYAYFRETEDITRLVLRDAETDPLVREVSTLRMADAMGAIADSLISVWPAGAANRELSAVVRLAMSFATWRTLVREAEFSDDEAIEVMARAVAAAVAASAASRGELPARAAVSPRGQ